MGPPLVSADTRWPYSSQPRVHLVITTKVHCKLLLDKHHHLPTNTLIGPPEDRPLNLRCPHFLPPPPPHGHQIPENGGNNLPSFSHSLYSPYHGPGGNLPPSNPHGMAHSMPSYSHISALSGTASGFQYTNHSPMGLNEPLTSHSRSQITHSYHDPPRLPGYSSSPNLHQLSPVSPTAHLLPNMQPPSASPSSSSFPSSIPRTPATLPKGVKRHSLGSEQSFDSWDDEQDMPSGKITGDRKYEKDPQPWGMPQEEYKKLNPKDKKQVRNR